MTSIQLKNSFLFFILLVFLQNNLSAQKVGLVFSGGGAAGYAHIGVLKALEENHIPIDYITGTSQGALIGSMYAMGMSPFQMEAFVKSDSFKNMTIPIIEDKYAYYFKHSNDDASWLTFKLAVDSGITVKLPTNIMNPISLDFALMENAAGPSAAAKYNFDSLFVPYRCVGADIEKKETIIFKNGDLGQAVRASIAYPFFLPPAIIGNKLIFDGGFYNNFPSNVMYDDFYPDFIIGSTVAANSHPPDEDNALSQLKVMMIGKTNFDVPCENGVMIKPKTYVSLFDFSNPQPTIDSGYVATMRAMNFIKQHVQRRVTPDELEAKRNAFNKKAPKILFDNIFIEGLNKYQSQYARKILLHKNKEVNMEEIKEGYFRLASDNKIKYIYPKAKFNTETGYYDLYLKIKKERDIITYLGGNFSNRPISTGYLGAQYNYLGRFATEIMANAYFGKLYSSLQLKTRFDFPSVIPFYIEPNITWNKWDYYSSSNSFLQDIKPAYLKQSEQYGDMKIGLQAGNKGRLVIGAGGGSIIDNYYQTSNFTTRDTADRTDFEMFTSQAYYEINTLNRKQYANQGEYLNIKIRYVNGMETNTPGSTSTDTLKEIKNNHEWAVLKVKAERYFNRRGTLKIGLLGEGVYSTQTLFHNYTSSVLAAPAFQPTPDSKTLFLENYRAYQYLAGGLKFVVNFRPNIELHVEGYVFQPVQTLIETSDKKTVYGKTFATQHYIGTAAAVWNSPVGPMSLSVNYYDQPASPFSILFHFGYIIFNKRALE